MRTINQELREAREAAQVGDDAISAHFQSTMEGMPAMDFTIPLPLSEDEQRTNVGRQWTRTWTGWVLKHYVRRTAVLACAAFGLAYTPCFTYGYQEHPYNMGTALALSVAAAALMLWCVVEGRGTSSHALVKPKQITGRLCYGSEYTLFVNGSMSSIPYLLRTHGISYPDLVTGIMESAEAEIAKQQEATAEAQKGLLEADSVVEAHAEVFQALRKQHAGQRAVRTC